VSQGFGGLRSSSSFSCTCICITNYFFSLTEKGSQPLRSYYNKTATHDYCDQVFDPLFAAAHMLGALNSTATTHVTLHTKWHKLHRTAAGIVVANIQKPRHIYHIACPTECWLLLLAKHWPSGCLYNLLTARDMTDHAHPTEARGVLPKFASACSAAGTSACCQQRAAPASHTTQKNDTATKHDSGSCCQDLKFGVHFSRKLYECLFHKGLVHNLCTSSATAALHHCMQTV
jgi:hypothetical protein